MIEKLILFLLVMVAILGGIVGGFTPSPPPSVPAVVAVTPFRAEIRPILRRGGVKKMGGMVKFAEGVAERRIDSKGRIRDGVRRLNDVVRRSRRKKSVGDQYPVIILGEN